MKGYAYHSIILCTKSYPTYAIYQQKDKGSDACDDCKGWCLCNTSILYILPLHNISGFENLDHDTTM